MKNFVIVYHFKTFCRDLNDYENRIEFINVSADSPEEAENYFVEDMEAKRNLNGKLGLNTDFFYDVLLICSASFAYASLLTDSRESKEILDHVDNIGDGFLYELLLSELCAKEV